MVRSVCCALLFAATISLAQTDRGVITGTVRDATGAVVPGAQVTATHTATNTSFKTNTTSSGDFTAPSLPVGAYQVRVENPGFRTHIRENVVLTAGSTARVDVQLEVGATQQTVEVIASAQMLMTDTARVSSQVSNTLVNQLPVVVNGGVRSPFDLASITPDVTGTGGDFRIAGGTANHFGMTLDGVSLSISRSASGRDWVEINAPSVESITEFAVESGGFKAEFGQASGGSVSFVSKSGTNAVHGSAYEFLRNQKLDARGFFGATKPVYKQNNFGATVGGPVWIPKLYNGRDRTFFFFSYEGFRNRVGASPTPYSVPPPEFFTGDLRNYVDASGKMYQIYDPGTQRLVGSTYVRDPFVNNQIPQNRFDPIAKAINAYVQPLLKANVPGLVPGTSGYTRNNYISYGTSISPQNKYNFKGDQVLTTNHRLSFIFGRTRDIDYYGPEGAPGLPKPLSGNPGYNRSDVYRVSWDYTLSPTWLNRFYAGINRWRQNHGSYATYKRRSSERRHPHHGRGVEGEGDLHPQLPRLQRQLPSSQLCQQRVHDLGRGRPQRFGQHCRRVQGRHDQEQRPPHVQVGLHVQPYRLQRLRAAEHRGKHDLQPAVDLHPAEHQPGDRRRQCVRGLPAGPREQLQPRHASLYQRAVALSRHVFPGRLAGGAPPYAEPRPAIRVHPAAEGGRGPVQRTGPGEAESRRGRTFPGPWFSRALARAGRIPVL